MSDKKNDNYDLYTEHIVKEPWKNSKRILNSVDFSFVSLTQNDKIRRHCKWIFLLRLRLASHIKKASVAVIQTTSPNFALTSTPKPDSTLWLQSILAPLLQAV